MNADNNPVSEQICEGCHEPISVTEGFFIIQMRPPVLGGWLGEEAGDRPVLSFHDHNCILRFLQEGDGTKFYGPVATGAMPELVISGPYNPPSVDKD